MYGTTRSIVGIFCGPNFVQKQISVCKFHSTLLLVPLMLLFIIHATVNVISVVDQFS